MQVDHRTVHVEGNREGNKGSLFPQVNMVNDKSICHSHPIPIPFPQPWQLEWKGHIMVNV